MRPLLAGGRAESSGVRWCGCPLARLCRSLSSLHAVVGRAWRLNAYLARRRKIDGVPIQAVWGSRRRLANARQA